jgi:hypothetical protein
MKTKQLNIVIILILACLALCVISYCGIFIYGLSKDPQLSFKNYGKQIVDSQPLKVKLLEMFPSDDIVVEITNGHILVINMINSGDLKSTEVERRQKAWDIAGFTKDNYRSIDSIDLITINFIERVIVGLQFEQFLTYNVYVEDLK